jgi:ubiquinone/menaquinone biosynthesis C-methylase UbiE
MAAAECVGPTGWVLGLDLASELLELARKKMVAAGFAHVEFREGDAQRLDLGDNCFDVVLCASSLFLIPDMLAALREWHRVLRPGGQVVFSGFGPTLLEPLIDLWRARLQQYVGSPPNRRWTQRLAEPDKCLHLLHEAGFEKCEVKKEQQGYLRTAEEWWEELMSSLYWLAVLKLPAAQREQIQVEYLSEVQALANDKRVWVDVPVIFAHGWKRIDQKEG